MSLSDETVVKLLKVKEAILNEPQRFNMTSWFNDSSCGTTACIAGHAVLLKTFGEVWPGYKETLVTLPSNLSELGAEILGLGHNQACRLFFTSDMRTPSMKFPTWPEQCTADYRRAYRSGDLAKAAQIAADRIDLFIASGGEV